MLAAGDLVAGKFQIDRVIGRGGMGFVVAATHIHLGQRVALKFLLPELANDRGVVERFLREARASAQLRGEHICRVSDVGVLDNGAPYFVMELLEGRDLSSMLAEYGPLPVALVVDYVVQACMGLAEAHAAQIVHRDLKPANLFVTQRPDGVPLIKIVDFGIAKASAQVNVHLTRTDAVMGSPGYMSPEQLRSSRIADARSDIWALGVILFELTSGRQPFTAESITDLALRIAVDPTPALRGPAMPAGFDRVVYRCLEKDPARRFGDVAQLAAALAPFGGSMTRDRAAGVARVLAAMPGAPAAPPEVAAPAMPTTLGSSAASLEPAPGRRRRWGVALGALTAAAVATVAFVKLRSGEPHVEVTADPAAAPGARAGAVSPPPNAATPRESTAGAAPASDPGRAATPSGAPRTDDSAESRPDAHSPHGAIAGPTSGGSPRPDDSAESRPDTAAAPGRGSVHTDDSAESRADSHSPRGAAAAPRPGTGDSAESQSAREAAAAPRAGAGDSAESRTEPTSRRDAIGDSRARATRTGDSAESRTEPTSRRDASTGSPRAGTTRPGDPSTATPSGGTARASTTGAPRVRITGAARTARDDEGAAPSGAAPRTNAAPTGAAGAAGALRGKAGAATPRPDGAPSVRKVTRPPPPKAGSDDVGESRL